MPKPDYFWRRVAFILRLGLCLGIGLFVLVYVFVACRRMFFPYDLEWMEGALVDHVGRVMAGQPLYVAPDVGFTPFLYTPGYYYLGAISAYVFGLGQGALRLVSFLASILSMSILFRFAYLETGRFLPGWVAAGFFAASFAISGGWFDLARADSLMLACVLSALFLVRFSPEGNGWLWAGLAGFLAVMTKQSALLMLAPVAVYTLLAGRGRRRWFFLFGWLGPLVLSIAYLQWQSDGWFGYYTWLMPGGHPLAEGMGWRFWWSDLLKLMPVPVILALVWLLVPKLRLKRTPALFYGCAAVGFLVSAFGSRIHSGGYVNVIMPLYAWLGLLAAMGLHSFLQGWLQHPEKPLFFHAEEELLPYQLKADWRKCGWLLLVNLQFLALAYRPQHHLPDAADRQAGRELVAELRAADSPVWVPYHGQLARLAGKRPHAHVMALSDVIRSRYQPEGIDVEALVRKSFRSETFELIILNYPWFPRHLQPMNLPISPMLHPAPFIPKQGCGRARKSATCDDLRILRGKIGKRPVKCRREVGNEMGPTSSRIRRRCFAELHSKRA